MNPQSPRILDRSGLDRLITELRRRGYAVIGPRIRDEAIVYGEICGTGDLPVGWRDVQAPGRYRLERRDDDALFGYVVGPQGFRPFFHVPEERLFSLRRKGTSFEAVQPEEPAAPRLALFGARGCDLAAMATQDIVFMQASVPDPRYAARRSDVVVVAVSCNEPAATCFCVSMGTGPTPHDRGPIQPPGPRFDLALTELVAGDRFLVEVGSDVGSELLAAVAGQPADEADVDKARDQAEAARAAMVRHVDNDGIKDLLYAAAEHPRFDDVASRCLTCTNCTMVCPTCFCGRVDDATSLDGETAERTRSWDSCFSLDHSHMHGGPARGSVKSRYRQWLTHKLASWHDQFGVSGCVGCGRCITWCPAGIDITEEVAAIRATKDEP